MGIINVCRRIRWCKNEIDDDGGGDDDDNSNDDDDNYDSN